MKLVCLQSFVINWRLSPTTALMTKTHLKEKSRPLFFPHYISAVLADNSICLPVPAIITAKGTFIRRRARHFLTLLLLWCGEFVREQSSHLASTGLFEVMLEPAWLPEIQVTPQTTQSRVIIIIRSLRFPVNHKIIFVIDNPLQFQAGVRILCNEVNKMYLLLEAGVPSWTQIKPKRKLP